MCAVEISINVNTSVKQFNVLGIYRPPNESLNAYLDHLESILPEFVNKPLIICGDMNVDIGDCRVSDDYSNVMRSNNFFPLISIPTRVTENRSSCLDHIWYNQLNVSLSGVIVSDITDHFPVFTMITIPINDNVITQTFRNHSEKNIEYLLTDIDLICNSYCDTMSQYNVNDKCTWFLDQLQVAYDHNCPVMKKTVSLKRLLKPWICSDMRRMSNYKHHLFKQFKMERIPFETYNQYKNNFNKKLALAKKSYYKNKFNSCFKDIKQTWKTINSVLNKSKSKQKIVSILNERGDEVNNPSVVSNLFCNYFSTVAERLDAEIPLTQVDPMFYMNQPITNSFSPHPASTDEVCTLINSLKDKPCHFSNIPVFIYKRIASRIAPIICDIFDSSINEGVFPDVLKLAMITPLHKGKSCVILNNYRPISILPLLSKIMEKLMKKRCLEFINNNNILCDQQFGFRTGRNTTDAILKLTDEITTALDEKLITVAVFLDLSKAFDTVNNSILLQKLDRLGFRNKSNDLFKSYLADRQMLVNVNGCSSAKKTINIGVPQGSVSSSWLFSLYINDMQRSSDKLRFLHFADDTTVYKSGKDLAALCNEICVELDKLDTWLKANRLSLNIDKTCCMVFTHKKYDPDDVVLKIRDKRIQQVMSTRFLGMQIDNRLNYNEHVIMLARKLSGVKGILRRLSCVVPLFIIRKLYYALFYSRMTYGIAVWGGGNITNVSKINNLNKSTVKIFSNDFNDNAVQPLSYKSVYEYYCLCFFHRYSINEYIQYFHVKIQCLIPVYNQNTRFKKNNNYSIPFYCKTTSHNQFFFHSIKFWNNLPVHLKLITSINEFKCNVKNMLRIDR